MINTFVHEKQKNIFIKKNGHFFLLHSLWIFDLRFG